MTASLHFIGCGRSTVTPVAGRLGGKAANLIRLSQLGLRVPPALVLDTAVARDYLRKGAFPPGFRDQLAAGLTQLEAATGLAFGHERPLLVSVRSSPPVSMPGMLESVLNVGLTEAGVSGLIRRTGNPWLAWDTYRRLVLAFADTVQRLSLEPFNDLARAATAAADVDSLQDLDAIAMRQLAMHSADRLALTGAPLPEDPVDQVVAAIEAVWRSWTAPRANEYRRLNRLDGDAGTGVIIQAMVFGNSGPRSGSGVGFTRNPATGNDELYVDFVFNSQGEDVVSGRHALTDMPPLAATMPAAWTQLTAAKTRLEQHFRDMQDFEFTIEDGELYFLQTRTGKRGPWAALRIATALAAAGIVERSEALDRLASLDLDHLVRVSLQPRPTDLPIARAVSASAGVAIGAIVFDPVRAVQLGATTPVILLRSELTTDDIAGVSAAAGLLTTFGGRTSHAAVVARQLAKVCLVGCRDLHVDDTGDGCRLGGRRLHEGDVITLDGDHGFVYAGRVPVVEERPDAELATIAAWRRQSAEPATAG